MRLKRLCRHSLQQTLPELAVWSVCGKQLLPGAPATPKGTSARCCSWPKHPAAARQVDVKHKRCMHEGCLKRPSFNYSGETRALYCGPHRLQHMVNVDQQRRRINRGELALEDVRESNLRQRTEDAAELAGVPTQAAAEANLGGPAAAVAAPASAPAVALEQGWTPAQLAAAAAAHLQAMLPGGAMSAPEAAPAPASGPPPEPDLLSLDDLRATAAAAAAGASAALGGVHCSPTGGMGHLMHSQARLLYSGPKFSMIPYCTAVPAQVHSLALSCLHCRTTSGSAPYALAGAHPACVWKSLCE